MVIHGANSLKPGVKYVLKQGVFFSFLSSIFFLLSPSCPPSIPLSSLACRFLMSSTVVENTPHLPLSFPCTILECQLAKEAWAYFYALGPVIVTQFPGWTPEHGSFATGHEVRWCLLSSPFHNCPFSSPLDVHTDYQCVHSYTGAHRMLTGLTLDAWTTKNTQP